MLFLGSRCFLVLFMWKCLAKAETTVTLDIVGDVSFDSAVKYFNKKGSCPYNKTLEHVARFLRQSDVAIGNLESPFITPDMRHDAQTQFSPVLSADADSVEALKFAGFDIMGLANNHFNDYGDKPVNYSVDVLNQAGIQSFGYTYGPMEEDRPQIPLTIEVRGIKIGFLAYCTTYRAKLDPNGDIYYHCIKKRGSLKAGPAIYSKTAATRDVHSLKSKVDVIVVYMHWGVEYNKNPRKSQEKQAAHLQSLGVQLVIGCHPHVLEGHVTHGAYLISYSLGNFLFGPRNWNKVFYCDKQPSKKEVEDFEKHMADSYLDNPTTQSRILRVQVDKNGIVAASYLPLRIHFDSQSKCLQPTPVPGAQWITVCSGEDKACLNPK